MFRFALVVAVATLQLGCKPSVRVPVALVTAQPSSTPTATATAAATATATPPVKGVAPKTQTPITVKATEKAFIKIITNEQEKRWQEGKIRPTWEIAANLAVMKFQKTRSRYVVVQNQRLNGVPAAVIFCLHYRESSNDFSTHLHEGSSLQHRTRYVPKGRPLTPDPPYKWEVSAEDAIYVADKLQGDWSDLRWAFTKMEGYNGWGYRNKGRESPYVESGTQYYVSGKYVADGRFSSTAVDQQLGCRAILIRMRERGLQPFQM